MLKFHQIGTSDPAASAAAFVNSRFTYWSDGTVDEQPLEVVKAAAVEFLQGWRGARRAAAGLSEARFQELVYARKAERCRAFLASGGDFPFEQEAVARGMTNAQLAELVKGEDETLLGLNDSIEAEYVTARDAIENAATIGEIEAALAALG